MKNIILILAMILLGAWVNHKSSIMITGTVLEYTGGNPLFGVTVSEKGMGVKTTTDRNGKYSISVQGTASILVFSKPGYIIHEEVVGNRSTINLKMALIEEEKKDLLMEMAVQPADVSGRGNATRAAKMGAIASYGDSDSWGGGYVEHNTEAYSPIEENIFHAAVNNPLSTFSIDVDAASYSNIRRFITQGQLPPKDAVRIEEMINYFSYDYPQPAGEDPFAIYSEVSECPWDKDHLLVHIGLQGKKIPVENLPPSNLVFLIDASGSMEDPNKLPLLKSAFKLLVNELRPQDRIAIVVYAGAAGMVLPSTAGDQKDKIIDALDMLEAGGSTAGGEGIILAYKIAQENLMKNGNNRIILATDGDFNIGASSDGEMQRLIEEKRETGVFLTVLGFGMGNYKDSKMEILADKGNGNYAYIDNILEAKKVFVNEFGGTLFTIAKDVKIQVEFNPSVVQAYRLVGYENRKLNNEDFNNDKKDAGELGAGHTVTAIYEIIPAGVESKYKTDVDPLKYQSGTDVRNRNTSELMTVKLRYKKPDEDTSRLIEEVIDNKKSTIAQSSENFRFSSAVVVFGMMLRESEFKGQSSFDLVLNLAKGAKGADEEGYRAEFIKMAESCKLMKNM